MQRRIVPIGFAILIIAIVCLRSLAGGTSGLPGARLLAGQCIALGLTGLLVTAHRARPIAATDDLFVRARRILFVTVMALLGAWYAALYPGVVIGADTPMMLSSVVGIDGYSPFSAFWNNVFGGLFALTGTLQVIPILNMVLCAWSIANLFAFAVSMHVDRYLIALIIFLLLFFPALPTSTLLWSRDATATLLRLALVTYVIWLCRTYAGTGIRPGWGPACIVALVAAACALTRSENLLLVVLVPATLLYYRVFSRRAALACVLGSTLAIVSFSGIVERQLYRNESKIDYSLSLFANPARYFYNNHFVSPTRAADVALLERVFDRDWLRGERVPYQPYHTKGMLFKSIDDATMRSLRITLLSIGLHNPTLFVDNRAIMAWTMLSGSPNADYHSLNVDFGIDPLVKSLYLTPHQVALYDALAVNARYRPENLNWVARRILTYFDPRRPNRPAIAAVVWTLLPALCFMLVALPGVRKRRLAALIPLLLFPCVAAVVLIAPAAHFKYVADLYVMGWFLPLLLYDEHRNKQEG